jgi:transcriptional regulator with XRE-family HTH domain
VGVADRDPAYIAIGKYMTRLRKEKKMTQGQVAQLMGVHATTITHYEAGTHRASITVFAQWCTVLGTQPGLALDRILGLVPDPWKEKET